MYSPLQVIPYCVGFTNLIVYTFLLLETAPFCLLTEDYIMPVNSDTAIKLLDAKIRVIFDLLKVHPFEEAICILENVKIELETQEDFRQKHAEVTKKITTLEAEDSTPA